MAGSIRPDEEDLLRWLADREDGRVPDESAMDAQQIEHVVYLRKTVAGLRRRGLIGPDEARWTITPAGRAAIGR